MEFRHIHIGSASGVSYTAQIINVSKANLLLGSLNLIGNQSNLTIPFNNPSFNELTDIDNGDQLALRVLIPGCPPQLTNLAIYDGSSNPQVIELDHATTSHYGVVKLATDLETDTATDNTAVLTTVTGLRVSKRDRFLSYVAFENIPLLSGKPAFIELYNDGGVAKLKKTTTKIDGAISLAVNAGDTAEVFLPGRTILSGYAGLVSGEKYALKVVDGTIVPLTNTAGLIYIGKAISATQILFDSSVSLTDTGGDLNDYVSKSEFGPEITASTELTPASAVKGTPFSVALSRALFSTDTGNASVVKLISGPRECVVTIDSTNVSIVWTPSQGGNFYFLFSVENGGMQTKVVSYKVNVTITTVTPPGVGVIASSPLTAGMLINIWDDAGTPKIRPARADSPTTHAVGFVSENVITGATTIPHFFGTNTGIVALTPGSRYFLSHTVAGGVSEFGPPGGMGYIWQPVGFANSAGQLELDIDTYTIRP